jgi:hypothetical protein
MILSVVILLLLLVAGFWLFIYGSNLEQKTIITPVGTISPAASPEVGPVPTSTEL